MRSFAVLGGTVALLSASCSLNREKANPPPIAEVLSVVEADVRMGLTADDGVEGEAVIDGVDFEKVSPSSHVKLMTSGVGRGRLSDGNNAVAGGEAFHSMKLQASVEAKPGAPGAKSTAQTVQLSTTALSSSGVADEVRVELETVLEGTLTGMAMAICEVEGEALLDGHSMAKISAKWHLHPEGGKIVVYRGPRSSGREPLGTIGKGGRFKSEDPSFYFKLGPGVYQLLYTLKLSAVCPAGQAGSTATLKAAGEVGLR